MTAIYETYRIKGDQINVFHVSVSETNFLFLTDTANTFFIAKTNQVLTSEFGQQKKLIT